MYDNIRQNIGSNRQENDSQNGYSYLQDINSNCALAPSISTTNPGMESPVSVSLPGQTTNNVSPILPGTGRITHNIMRLLNDSDEQQIHFPTNQPSTVRYSPYSTAHFMSFRYKMLDGNSNSPAEKVASLEHSTCSDSGDMSISTDGSISPGISSARSSPCSLESSSISDMSPSFKTSSKNDTLSSIESPSSRHYTSLLEGAVSIVGSSPSSDSETSSLLTSTKTQGSGVADSDEQPKKKARTNYTNEQVHALLKIFLKTPYPDSEMMENIGKDLGIPEKKVKIWFQNKRARWRRRVNVNNCQQPWFPMSPVPQPANYGFVPTGHMITSLPVPRSNPYYQWMQGYPSHNSATIPRHTDQIPPKFQGYNQSTAAQTQYSVSMAPFVPNTSSAHYGGTLVHQGMMSTPTRQSFQYTPQLHSFAIN